MPTITVWQNASSGSVRICQLSDVLQDGTASEQIAHLATLSYLDGYSCVCEDYMGTAPAGDPSQWRWDGVQITAASAVPASVSPRQVRLLLLAQGLLESVEAMIASQDQATQITWQYALEFKRNDPLLAQLAANLGLSPQQVDEFFIAAAAL